MTTRELVGMVHARGLVILACRGRVVFGGDEADITPPLQKVLRWHEAEIVRMAHAGEVPQVNWPPGGAS